MLASTFLVWNWGVVTSFIGLSAQGLEGVTELIMNGARVSINPKARNGMEKMNLVRMFSIVTDKARAGPRKLALRCRMMNGRELVIGWSSSGKVQVGPR